MSEKYEVKLMVAHLLDGQGSVAYGLNVDGIGGGTYVGYGALVEAPYGTGMPCICDGYGTEPGAELAGVDGAGRVGSLAPPQCAGKAGVTAGARADSCVKSFNNSSFSVFRAKQ